MPRRILLLTLAFLGACAGTPTDRSLADPDIPGTEVATFGAGCFWCAEAAFEQLDGVVDVRSGFMGGEEIADPTADRLAAAGHAEVVRVRFDPARVEYATLLDWFWKVHDPTSVDKQGGDEGPEYRSVVFVNSRQQWDTAVSSRDALRKNSWRPIQTKVQEESRFYPAAPKHQDYYRRNRETEYCRTVIAPHLEGAGLEK